MTFYLVAYLLMTLLSFAVLVIVAQQTGEEISDFDGLAKRSPFLAFAMLIAMASLAGVPLTAGFFGKFFIFYAAIAQRQTALVVVGVITVACGFYYYLKVVRAMYWQPAAKVDNIPVNVLSRLAMSALIVAIIWLGIYPAPILEALKGRRFNDSTLQRITAKWRFNLFAQTNRLARRSNRQDRQSVASFRVAATKM